MNKEQILDAIYSLAHSQGFYGRLYEAIQEDDSILEELESQNFSDVVDLVLYLET